jgi:hypothetical protein
MKQDEIIAMARQVGYPIQHSEWQKATEEFAALVEEKATEETKARTYASWTLMCKKMVAFEREDIIQIIKETPFSNWFQADVIEAIRARGEQA